MTSLPRCEHAGCNLLATYATVDAVGRYGEHLAWTSKNTCWQHGDSAAIELSRALDNLKGPDQ